MFSSFHPLADKTNKEHLPKTLFKVMRKSLSMFQRKTMSDEKDVVAKNRGTNSMIFTYNVKLRSKKELPEK